MSDNEYGYYRLALARKLAAKGYSEAQIRAELKKIQAKKQAKGAKDG